MKNGNDKGKLDIDFEKIAKIMNWQREGKETHEELFFRKGKRIEQIPASRIVDVAEAGSLKEWAETIRVKSQEEMVDVLKETINMIITDPALQDKKTLEEFPRFKNILINCNMIERNGTRSKVIQQIAEQTWNMTTSRKILKEQIDKMFSVKPDKEKFESMAEKIKHIWGFSDTDIDAIRYFVCQTREENLNPSLNKGIYIFGREKGTGKTTIARALVTILNGDEFNNFGKYESTLSTEMQYNDHDIPAAALYNAVILDESMPKDATKSYGLIKQVLTSNSCKYNQKYGAITRIPCRRNYVWTSNDDISEFIQDDKERRFYAIRMDNMPERIPFKEIYEIWKEFCINCEPKSNWDDWYNSFVFVEGVAAKEENDIENEIILRRDELFKDYPTTYITAKQVAGVLYKNEPTRMQMATIRMVMNKLFESCKLASNKSYFSASKCLDIAYKMKQEIDMQEALLNGDDEKGGNEDDLPF